MILLEKLIISGYPFYLQTNYSRIHAAIVCSVKYSPEAYSTKAKLLRQQLFASYFGFFVEGVWEWNSVNYAFLSLLIVTANVGILESSCPGIFYWKFCL